MPIESMAGGDRRPDAVSMADQLRRRPAFHRRPAGRGFIFETWQAQFAGGTNWQAGNGAIFNLNSNGLRMEGRTSGDAAGFPMFPALVRYDEAERGMIEHACRLVVAKSRKAYIYPATHYASSHHERELSSHGPAVAAEGRFRHPRRLDEGGKGGAGGLEEIRRDGGGQRELLFDFGDAGRPLAGGIVSTI